MHRPKLEGLSSSVVFGPLGIPRERRRLLIIGGCPPLKLSTYFDKD
jgi:hypothetical protein